MKTFNSYILLAASVLLLAAGCNKESQEIDTRNEIVLSPTISYTDGATKANVFEENADLSDESKGGGNFSVRAYKDGTQEQFLYDQRVWYFRDGKSWHFFDDKINNTTQVPWPNTFNLDFFAYMPYHNAGKKTGVTINSYSATAGPSFSCELPLDGQEDLYEFIYAFTPDQNKTTVGPDGKEGVVLLSFVHPFSAVQINLKQSYRMDIKTLSISNIYNKGTYSNSYNTIDFGGEPQVNFTHTCWTPAQGHAKTQTLTAQINKNVPDDINYNSPIGGPYIIMPQSVEGIELTIVYERDDKVEDPIKVSLYTSEIKYWEPGKLYNYNLVLGDPMEEILFNVEVEEWGIVEYKNEIGVE